MIDTDVKERIFECMSQIGMYMSLRLIYSSVCAAAYTALLLPEVVGSDVCETFSLL